MDLTLSIIPKSPALFDCVLKVIPTRRETNKTKKLEYENCDNFLTGFSKLHESVGHIGVNNSVNDNIWSVRSGRPVTHTSNQNVDNQWNKRSSSHQLNK